MKSLKQFIYNSLFFRNLKRKNLRKRAIKELQPWAMNGFPLPPPHIVKQFYLLSLATKHKLTTFIETGTYLGDMIFALEPYFTDIFSIEIDETLYSKAKQRFKNSKNITLHHGDSGRVLQKVIAGIQKPSLIWLDGHYSGHGTGMADISTPIIDELNAIRDFCHNECLVVIDDLHCFNGTGGYPSSKELTNVALQSGFSVLEKRLNTISFRNAKKS